MQGHDIERRRLDDNTWECECRQCGKWFESKRSDASFCSSRCRVNHSREPQKRLNAIEDLKSMQSRMSEIARKYRYDDEIFQIFLSVEKTVKYCQANFEA